MKAKKNRKNPDEMTILEHIEELRIRLLWILGGVFIGLVATYSYSEQIVNFAIAPLKYALPTGSKIIFTGVTEAFWIRIETALVAAIIVSIPFTFYQIWLFIKPGLRDSERRFMLPFVLAFTVFFISGVSFAYKIVLPIGFKFLLKYGGVNLSAMPSIKQYMSLFLRLVMAFGLVFELPTISFVMSRMGIINAKDLWKRFDYALLAIFVTAAVLTPPDIFTQFLMAGPLIVLYIISILVAYIFSTKAS